MTVRIDFSLSGRFSVVERTIFRLVLDGVKDVKTITMLLCVYSDEVIANAIKKLVNYQILRANLETRTIDFSGSIRVIIEGCIEQSGKLEINVDDDSIFYNGTSWIVDEDIKRQILKSLLPGINTEFLVKSLDFVLYRGEHK